MLLGIPALLLVAAALALKLGTGAAEPPRQQDPQVAELLDEARLAAEGVNYELDRARAFQVVARAQAVAGDVAAARTTLLRARAAVAEKRTMAELRPASYLDVAADQLRLGDAAGAKDTFADAIRAAAAIPDKRQRWFDFARIAVARSRAGDTGGATLDFATALAASNDDSDLWRVAGMMASVGRFAGAEAVADGLTTNTWRASAFRDVAIARSRAGDFEGARRVARRLDGWDRLDVDQAITRAKAEAGDLAGALDVARGIPERYPSAREAALAGVVLARADVGDVAGARAAAAGVPWRSHAAEVLAALALAQARSGDAVGARATAAEAREAAAADDVAARERAWLYVRVARAQALAGDHPGARQSFADAREAAGQMGFSTYDQILAQRALARIASAQAETGDLTSARATAAAIESDESRAVACRAIAIVDARRGDLPGVERWIEALPDRTSRAYAYAGAAEALATKGSEGDLSLFPEEDE